MGIVDVDDYVDVHAIVYVYVIVYESAPYAAISGIAIRISSTPTA